MSSKLNIGTAAAAPCPMLFQGAVAGEQERKIFAGEQERKAGAADQRLQAVVQPFRPLPSTDADRKAFHQLIPSQPEVLRNYTLKKDGELEANGSTMPFKLGQLQTIFQRVNTIIFQCLHGPISHGGIALHEFDCHIYAVVQHRKLHLITYDGELGSGGYGTVYKVWEICTGKLWAMKERNDEAENDIPTAEKTASLKYEISLLTHLHRDGRKPYIQPPPYLVFDIPNIVFSYVTELYRIDLHHWVYDYPNRPAAERIQLCKKLVQAFRNFDIEAWHRDIKGNNIMVDYQDNPIVIDWGIAMLKNQAQRNQINEWDRFKFSEIDTDNLRFWIFAVLAGEVPRYVNKELRVHALTQRGYSDYLIRTVTRMMVERHNLAVINEDWEYADEKIFLKQAQ